MPYFPSHLYKNEIAGNILAVTQVRTKGFWLLSTVEKLLKSTIPSLSHESDGLIFQVTIRLFIF